MKNLISLLIILFCHQSIWAQQSNSMQTVTIKGKTYYMKDVSASNIKVEFFKSKGPIKGQILTMYYPVEFKTNPYYHQYGDEVMVFCLLATPYTRSHKAPGTKNYFNVNSATYFGPLNSGGDVGRIYFRE